MVAAAVRPAHAASARCSTPPARAVARRPRCHSSRAAISRCTARRVFSSVVEETTGRAGAVTRVGVATRWRAANSGDHSDNHVTAHLTGPENKLPWKPAPGAYLLGTTNARC